MIERERPVAANDNAPREAGEFTTLSERRAWLETLPKTIATRKAKTKKPKLAHLSRQLRALLTWRVISAPQDFTSVPTVEGLEEGERANMDCLTEVRPLPSEIMAAIGTKVIFRDVPEARYGGGGGTIRIAVGGDVERHGPEEQDGKKPKVVTRMGNIRLSNGASQERCLVLKGGVVGTGRARIPMGGIVRVGRFEPRDTFRRPKGAPPAANDNASVRPSQTASPAAFNFADPVAEREHLEWVREAVGEETACILDHALVAANLAEIGERLGFNGKTAERQGKLSLIAACAVLEEKLAA